MSDYIELTLVCFHTVMACTVKDIVGKDCMGISHGSGGEHGVYKRWTPDEP